MTGHESPGSAACFATDVIAAIFSAFFVAHGLELSFDEPCFAWKRDKPIASAERQYI